MSPGHGRFQWVVVAAMGVANASDAIELLAVSLLLPAAACDLDISSRGKGWLNAAVFIGACVRVCLCLCVCTFLT